MPDDLGRRDPSGRRQFRLIDLLDGYLEFASGLPGLLHTEGPEQGYPLSWRHYVYGLAYLRRERLREMLRLSEAVRAAGAVKGYEEWQADLREMERRD